MHISSNEVPSQNQLAMGGVTHKLIYMLKPFNIINVGQHPLSYSLYFINVGQCPLSYSNIDFSISLVNTSKKKKEKRKLQLEVVPKNKRLN